MNTTGERSPVMQNVLNRDFIDRVQACSYETSDKSLPFSESYFLICKMR